MTATSNPKLGSVALALCALLCGIAAPAPANVYIVRNTTDSNDGACDAHCSLREAIVAANANPGMDYVTIPAGTYLLTIPGAGEDYDATGDLDVRDDVFISGAGPSATVIDATGLGDRVLDVVPSGVIAYVVSLTVTGGSVPTDYGGGMRAYQGDLVASNVVVTGNSANSGGGIGVTLGTATVQEGSVVRGNTANASWYGGGLFAGEYSGGLTVTDSTVSGNSAGAGGGIAAFHGPLHVTRSTIADNTDQGWDGGGVLVGDGATGVEFVNSTIYGNSSGRTGGGLFVATGADVWLHSVTIADNTAAYAASSAVYSRGHVTLTNTLIAGACHGEGGWTTSSNGGNLESPGDTCGMEPVLDLVNVADPLLCGLVNTGGSTATMVPLEASPAVGGGDDDYCLAEDQRGFPRSGISCEVGAVERQADDVLFADGFESGDAGLWSASNP